MWFSNRRQHPAKSQESVCATGEDKLIFLGLCSGKDNLDGVKLFLEAQLVTTFNSSIYTKPTENGGKQFTTGEDAALTEIIEGALKDEWETIGDNIERGGSAAPWELGIITPIDTQFNARLDGDSDGSVDL